MKTSFLYAGGLILLMGVVFGSLLIFGIVALTRRQYFPKALPNHAQSLLIAGQIAAALILLTAIFSPVKDFLIVTSTHHPLQNPALWSYVLICCSGVGIGYMIILYVTKLLIKLIFKGASTALALQENDWGYALILAVIQVSLSLIIVQALVLVLQALIPIPQMPLIR